MAIRAPSPLTSAHSASAHFVRSPNIQGSWRNMAFDLVGEREKERAVGYGFTDCS
jgi:hypothetical protein